MSATREVLCEKIKKFEEALRLAESKGEPTDLLLSELTALRKQLISTNEALNEGKSLLRG